MSCFPKCLFLLFLIAVQPSENWQRQVSCTKGSFVDFPDAHPLNYFIEDPFLRDDGNEFCSSCTPEDKAKNHLTMESKSEVHFVGTIKGYNIYDIFYYFGSDQIRWKSIIVEVGPDQFREIYHLQSSVSIIGPSFIFNAGKEILLGTKDPVPGTGAMSDEAYWWFDDGGVLQIDTGILRSAMQDYLPKGLRILKGVDIDFETLTCDSPVWRKEDGNCCPTGGSIHVKFKIKRGIVTITEKSFIPPQ